MARGVILGFAAILVAVLAFSAFVVNDLRHGVEPDGRRVRVTVAPGAAFVSVVDSLQQKNLIRRAWTLTFFARATRADRKMSRGTYEFARGTAPLDMLRAFVQGDILAVEITVPEGFNLWQVAGAFRRAGVDSTAMMEAIRDTSFVRALRIPGGNVEGYLYPDTYRVPYGSDARDIVSQMLTRFDEIWTPKFEQRAAELSMTRHEVVTLASIIEAEARVAVERPLVSAVYHNRLKIGMKLDADPTVAYARGGYRGRLYYRDLEVDSPYNTYRHPGLPPGPIGNPGRDSIHAALHPDESSRALFFVARGDGRHDFSVTLKEHNAAIRRIRSAGGKKTQ
jgi:UPF0755 protein